jgi:hypothetical protein
MGNVKIKNPDGSKHAFGSTNVIGPGVGNSVTIPSQVYSCGYNHTLTGKQESLTEMKGIGVSPWPDPGITAEKSPGGAVGPSWEATTGGPEPKPAK